MPRTHAHGGEKLLNFGSLGRTSFGVEIRYGAKRADATLRLSMQNPINSGLRRKNFRSNAWLTPPCDGLNLPEERADIFVHTCNIYANG